MLSLQIAHIGWHVSFETWKATPIFFLLANRELLLWKKQTNNHLVPAVENDIFTPFPLIFSFLWTKMFVNLKKIFSLFANYIKCQEKYKCSCLLRSITFAGNTWDKTHFLWTHKPHESKTTKWDYSTCQPERFTTFRITSLKKEKAVNNFFLHILSSHSE